MQAMKPTTAKRLHDVQVKLESMGVRDIKLHRDADRWNELTMDERATLLCDVFEAWMRGDYSPMKPLNDRPDMETKATRLAPRTLAERRNGPDDHVRCASCDSGLLPDEVFSKPRECCPEGKRFDEAALNRGTGL